VRSVAPDADTVLADGDVIVLRGTEEDLALAEMRLMQG
jgi:K+/H+ antiporter YhaU regulatory subunit KhtT